MLRTPLLAHYTTTVHVRPTRVAYFIDESDMPAFERAAQIAVTQWGGLYNLIVPVAIAREAQPIHGYFAHLLELFEPDVFVAYEDGPTSAGLNEVVTRFLAGAFPWRDIRLIDGRSFDENDHSMHAVGAVPDDERKRTVSIPKVPGWSSAVNLAAFGKVYPGQEDLYNEQLATATEVLDPTSDELWELLTTTAWNRSPLNLTSFKLRPTIVTDGTEYNAFDIVFGESVNSLCWFWATRAVREVTQFQELGRRTILCPFDVIANAGALDALLGTIRRKLSVVGMSSSIDLLCHTWTSDDYERVRLVLEEHPQLQKAASGRFTVSHSFGRDVTQEDASARKLTFLFVGGDAPGSFRAGAGAGISHPVEWVENAVNPVRHDPIPGIKSGWGNVCIDIECEVWKRLPRSKSLAASIHRDAWLSRWGLTHFSGAISAAKYDSYFLPSESAALSAWFHDRGLTIRTGQSGRYAEAMISLVGGVENLGVLATRQSHALVYRLALKSSKKVAQRVSQLLGTGPRAEADILTALGDLDVGPELKGIPRTMAQLMSDSELRPRDTVPTTVEALLRIGALRRGLFLQCPHCGTSDWHTVDHLQERLVCPGCSGEFSLPLLDENGSERAWQFRLNSLMNRAVDQDLIINALTLFRETSERQATCMAVGLEILRGDRPEAELDVCFVANQRLVAAECKTGDQVEEKDIARARFLASLGFAEFIFSTVKDAWSNEAQTQFKTLVDELASSETQMVVRTICGKDLFEPS
ncbi:MAG: hypothetical protein DMG02_06260 [Acidobacteria bacterium]|nr:MAG: hypothetical protein DMG02_06260 [Acidobacteriota bacterium]